MTDRPPALPWYTFLYRVFGAQGTFWLWVLALLAAWWTGSGALVRLSNLEASELAVAELPRDHVGRRWVILRGTELDLDRRLFQAQAPAGPPIAQLLLDAREPAAAQWARARAIADRVRSAGGPLLGDLAGAAAGVEASLAWKELGERRASAFGNKRLHLPAPGNGILLMGDEPLRAAAEAAPASDGGDALGQFDAALERWADLVRLRVLPNARRDGLLDEAPGVLLERLERDANVSLAPHALRLGRRPRDLELQVFGASLIVLLFLAAGFHGVRRHERDRLQWHTSRVP